MSETVPLTVRENPDRNRFEAVDESGVVAGFAAFRRHADRVVFTHTEVDDAFEHQGVGSTIVRRALDTVREEGLRVVAQCPFVTSFIEEHREYADLT